MRWSNCFIRFEWSFDKYRTMKSPFIKCVCFFIIFASFAAILVFAVIMKNRSNDSNDTKIIETKSGKIRGVRETTLIKNMDFYSFKGIPYAKPPIGELRFKVSFTKCRLLLRISDSTSKMEKQIYFYFTFTKKIGK